MRDKTLVVTSLLVAVLMLSMATAPSLAFVYPGGAQDILGIPRKQQGIKRLKTGLEKQGIKGLNDEMNDHELDAVTCALVGKLFLEGKTVTYGTRQQAIVMPSEKDRV